MLDRQVAELGPASDISHACRDAIGACPRHFVGGARDVACGIHTLYGGHPLAIGADDAAEGPLVQFTA